ncbi:MAG: acyl-CoA dehydrogenase [Bacteroidetes bacterium]|nr:MAG: acyl-CoA dehydrogenase [Bacteroidota bacterium]
MAREYVNMKNLRFLLHDVHQIKEVLAQPYYAEHDLESIDMMLDAVKQLSDTYLFPHYEDMDRNEPQLEGGEIKVHHSVRPYLDAMGEGGWIGAVAPMDLGGMQIPEMLGVSAAFVMAAANNGATGFNGLTTGAANLIVSFGSAEQKEKYLPKMFEGSWQGTMALTEPQAGSSLSDIQTTATPMPDGSYRIRGQKIYISAGDYTETENVVHMLLARIDGAPLGTKGISLFIVPKYREGEHGELVFNDVTPAGLYHKLGQKGTPATHLMYGEKDDCHGYLVGEPHRGLSYMFQMMNEARLLVGLGAVSIASAAYHASLQYAKERPQGRRYEDGKRDLTGPQTPIINHPDVRRMLLLQKAIVEGGLSLVMECARYADLAKAGDEETRAHYELLLDLLTPVAKTYPSEMGIVSISQGLQVLGGGGFCKDFPLENYYRDIRIYPIYEGTTGIQSQDLLGRKVVIKNGKAVKLLMAEIQKTLEAAEAYEDLRPYAEKLRAKLETVQQILMHLVPFAMQGKIERYLSDATLFMELFGLVVVAWQWLKQGVVAKQHLVSGKDDPDFMESKLHTMKFFYHYELPKTLGLAERLLDDTVLTIAEDTRELVN